MSDWEGMLGDPEDDPYDLYTPRDGGWFARAMQECRDREVYQRIVKCRSCKVNWSPQEYPRCYVRPECRPWKKNGRMI